MKLKKLAVRNFRGLQNISVEFDNVANVIVGPNAVGKTTILEAVRLAKAVLSPRVPDEAQNALHTLGVFSPHNPQKLNLAAICGIEGEPLNITAVFELSSAEASSLDTLIPDLATAVVRSSLGGSYASGQLPIVQFLSTANGRQALAAARLQVAGELPAIQRRSSITLDLTIDPGTQTLSGANPLDQLVFSALEVQLPPYESLFSYFPADRALPVGEVGIQIGGPDMMAQLQAHNAQAQQKYNRLKPTIINNLLFGAESAAKLEQNFKRIFTQVLKDRELVGAKVNRHGLVSVQIRQVADGRVFDIDAMSSGEKGLILTFLLIGNSVSEGGIVLIDEPELHLNPAVCKLLLPFLIDSYLVPKNMQAIICSHSPEVLGSAFDRKDCSLHHLQGPTVISKIYPEDKREVFDALKRLGTSASDVLFSNGNIFVEGDHDIDILETAFSKVVSKYNIAQLGGRSAVEQEIRTLQAAEGRGEIDTVKCFIFDLDRLPTLLKSTRLVKVLQWKRRCLENYLIDDKVAYDLLKEREISKKSISSRGEVAGVFKEIALSQLQDQVIEKVYDEFGFLNPGLRPKEVLGKGYADAAAVLFARLSEMQAQLHGLEKEEWSRQFVAKCEAEYAKESSKWDVDWQTLCDGKRFFRDLHARFEVQVSHLKFKKMVAERMEREQSAGWVLVEKLIADALRTG